MDVDAGLFHEPEHLLVILEGPVGMQPALEQDLGAAQGLGLGDLPVQFGKGQQVAAAVFRGLEKGAELAGRDADVGIVDIAVDDIGDHVLGMQALADGVGEKARS